MPDKVANWDINGSNLWTQNAIKSMVVTRRSLGGEIRQLFAEKNVILTFSVLLKLITSSIVLFFEKALFFWKCTQSILHFSGMHAEYIYLVVERQLKTRENLTFSVFSAAFIWLYHDSWAFKRAKIVSVLSEEALQPIFAFCAVMLVFIGIWNISI